MTTTTIETKQAQRFLILERAYLLNDDFSERDLQATLSMSREAFDDAVEYLQQEGLLEFVALGGVSAITHSGRKTYEEAKRNPGTETTYFPPLLNFIHINSMSQSQVQVGSHHSNQVQHNAAPGDLDALAALITAIRNANLELSVDQRDTLNSDLATIEVQASRPQKKWHFIRESLESVRTVLEGTGAGVLAEQITRWLAGAP